MVKVLVAAILCAFMVGCAQAEQPVQQDTQTAQTQQSDVKEDTQTAEQTRKETPEEVLQRCTLKGEWSILCGKIMACTNILAEKRCSNRRGAECWNSAGKTNRWMLPSWKLCWYRSYPLLRTTTSY